MLINIRSHRVVVELAIESFSYSFRNKSSYVPSRTKNQLAPCTTVAAFHLSVGNKYPAMAEITAGFLPQSPYMSALKKTVINCNLPNCIRFLLRPYYVSPLPSCGYSEWSRNAKSDTELLNLLQKSRNSHLYQDNA